MPTCCPTSWVSDWSWLLGVIAGGGIAWIIGALSEKSRHRRDVLLERYRQQKEAFDYYRDAVKKIGRMPGLLATDDDIRQPLAVFSPVLADHVLDMFVSSKMGDLPFESAAHNARLALETMQTILQSLEKDLGIPAEVDVMAIHRSVRENKPG